MAGKTAPNRSPNKLENAGQWRSLIASIDTVLFDCDGEFRIYVTYSVSPSSLSTGVLWVGNADPVSQAAQTINYLRTLVCSFCKAYCKSLQNYPMQGKKICFVTNNSSKSRDEYLKKFQTLKISAHKVLLIHQLHVHTYLINCI